MYSPVVDPAVVPIKLADHIQGGGDQTCKDNSVVDVMHNAGSVGRISQFVCSHVEVDLKSMNIIISDTEI